jgi:hypothetical protein
LQVSAAAPLFSRLEADRTLQTMLSLLLPQLRLDSHAIKLQLNEGACQAAVQQLGVGMRREGHIRQALCWLWRAGRVEWVVVHVKERHLVRHQAAANKPCAALYICALAYDAVCATGFQYFVCCL